jgi:hypothetical protein
MKYKKLLKNYPILLIKNFEVVDDSKRESLVNIVYTNSKKTSIDLTGYSFPLFHDPTCFFANLLKKFRETCVELFGDLKYLPTNNDFCWAYCSNSGDYAEIWHDHMKTSTINSVYYLNVPNCSGGEIEFDLGKNKTFKYKPSNFDLLIFPNYLRHRPLMVNSKELRVSINMEFLCEEQPFYIFDFKER